MRQFWLFTFLVVALMYGVAVATMDREPDDGLVRLRWSTDPNPVRDRQGAGFSAFYPRALVRMEPSGDDKLLVQCLSGAGPDLIDLYSVEQMINMAEAGVLLDLTPYADSLGFGLSATYPALRDDLVYDDRQWRYPCNAAAHAVILNTAVFADHGVPLPGKDWSYDDLIDLGRRFRETPAKSGEKHLFFLPLSSLPLELFATAGVRFFDPGGRRCLLDRPEAKEAMRFYADLMFRHRVVPTAVERTTLSSQGGWGAGQQALFYTGKVAMITMGRWVVVQALNYPGLEERMLALPMPSWNGRPGRSYAYVRGAGINRFSPRREEALQFLRYLASEEYNRIVIDSGDSMPPNPRYAPDGRALVCPYNGDPDFHQVFVDAMAAGVALDTSPFVNMALVMRWFNERVEMVENQLIDPADALDSLTAEINAKIADNLAESAALRAKYEAGGFPLPDRAAPGPGT